MFTPHQACYFANWLTQTGKTEEQVNKAVLSARVDMNPHQVEAAIFALHSPLSKGALLADEVGLGKTIEASLVIAQKWAEQKRKILLVVPAALQKQWQSELSNKFELPSVIIDNQYCKAQQKKEGGNPFIQSNQLVICSYHCVASNELHITEIEWDLVVFDEAHKLRNIYKKSSKHPKSVVNATKNANKKILLSATPVQTSLMELYGLSTVIDPHFFGSADAFKRKYIRKKDIDVQLQIPLRDDSNEPHFETALDELKHRITPLIHRTLRKDVHKEGGINFTNRYAMTQDFTPTEKEAELSLKLGEFLQRDTLTIIAPQSRHLMNIGLHKNLASSSFAVAHTLRGMVNRINNKGNINTADLMEIDGIPDTLEDYDPDEQALRDTDIVSEPETAYSLTYSNSENDNFDVESNHNNPEVTQLKECYELAKNIQTNAKGQALLEVLQRATEMASDLGGAKKAVIFTERRYTQQYIQGLLEQYGYAGKTVILNGENNDESSREIYERWLKEHLNSDVISGVKKADMKAALVDAFEKGDADILISTEAGGEGINLQFCSVLINYDLPWNPAKVEQRIGRIHRYGQKNDVVIVNFVNRSNIAENRVFELLSERLKLFEGVFGASDEILGNISADIDVGKRIREIYQDCRSTDKIKEQFDKLQRDIDEVLAKKDEQTKANLLDNFDINVVQKLKIRRDENQRFLQRYQQTLLNLVKAEVPEVSIDLSQQAENDKFRENHFFFNGTRHDLEWPLVQKNNSAFFRLLPEGFKASTTIQKQHSASTQKSCLDAWDLVNAARRRTLSPAHLTLKLDALGCRHSELEKYAGQNGLLSVVKLITYFPKRESSTYKTEVVSLTADGQQMSEEIASQLLSVQAVTEKETGKTEFIKNDALQERLIDLQEQCRGTHAEKTEQEMQAYMEEESRKCENWTKDIRDKHDYHVAKLDAEIKDKRKQSRQLKSAAEKLTARKQLRKLEAKRDEALHIYNEDKKRIDAKEDELLEELESKTEFSVEIEELFTVSWSLTH